MISVGDFQALVASEFSFLVEEFKFSRLESGDNLYEVRFESSDVCVRVCYDARRSFQLLIYVGLLGDDALAFTVGDIARVSDVPSEEARKVDLMQTVDPETMGAFLRRCAAILREHGGPVLRGEAPAFARLIEDRKERSHALTVEVRLQPVIERAEEAWRRKDFVAVVEALSAHTELLRPRESRWLEFAERRVRDAHGSSPRAV